ncbi:PAN2-PAN3 deadenylation complex catalytic subunit PAN2-like [Ruditapes philippinarum]|uniref:PAN2-PAN3 deadenylation complex catalytic subunit PAN2-like n=1 Tax=Ruditapes philippinarum TaxID=129788 RepID=UPI00295AD43A|nr:PAN2-PAN3 deadenylation complex catalytic subunit PAN2-like [Ruditapes philippinarum]
MDYNQIPMNPYAGAEIQVDASQAPRMIDPNMIDPNMIDPTMIDPTLMNPYAPPMFPGAEAAPLPNQEYKQLHSLMVDGGDRFGVSCLCFDTQELLWMGNQGGHVTSYYGPSLQKYTSFQMHQNEDVRQMAPLKDRGILSLTQSSLRLSVRRGTSQFTFQSPDMHDMQCMLVTSPTSLLIGGHHTKVIDLDLTTVTERQKFEVPDPGCAILRTTSKCICAGDTSGKVTLYDPNTMKAEHVFDAHSGTLSDFDIHGNLLVTCGFSSRVGNLTPDRYLKMYDLRMMRSMSPLQLIIDPTFLRFVPTYSSRLAVVSQVGQFQVIEATGTASLNMYQVQCHNSIIMSFDVAATCQALAFGDSGGYLHLFATDENIQFNPFHEDTDLADPVEPSQNIHIHDFSTPYAMVPMSYPGTGKLLSDWPEYLCEKVYRKPKQIDSEILRTMKVYHNVGYAPNPGKERRNQIPYTKGTEGTAKGKSNIPESPLGRGDDPFMAIPKRFRKVDLKYSKLGLEDFDFRHYNKTHFAGLEIHIPNVYCNSMLQIFYFIEPLRVKLLNHLCDREFCLSCELGFLFHMLDKQKGQTSQASNFLRAFRTLPEAAALGLVLAENEEVAGRTNLGRLIQSWQRFMHQQIHSETSPRPMIENKLEVPEVEKEETVVEGATAEAPPPVEEPEKPVEEKVEKEKEVKKEEPKSSKSKKKKKKGKKDKKEDKEAKKAAATETTQGSVTEQPAEKPEGEGTETPVESPREEKEKKDGSVVNDIFGLDTVTTLRCRCGQENTRQNTTTLVNLNYPDCSGQGLNKGPVPKSGKQQSKEVLTLPDVLALNCQLENPRDLEFWKIQLMLLKQKDEGENSSSTSSSPIPLQSTTVMCRYGRKCTKKGCRFRHEQDNSSWLQDDIMKIHTDDENDPVWIPFGLQVKLENGKLKIEEFPDDEPLPDDLDPNTKYYELHGTVSHIKDSKGGGHLVSHIKVGETFHQRKEGVTTTQFYLFNDFSISDVEKEEAVRFNLEWRVPCTLYFIRRNIKQFYDITVVNPITSTVLTDESTLINPKRRKMTFLPFTDEESPKEGDIIGLDAEFVSLNQEESELRSDGTRSTLRPSHMSVARITCIRGQGENLGEPFIDDYICSHEQVVDYLTQYSGIKPGDLDPTLSNRHLTTLKATYQKIRYLVDTGVIFVGHGLKKDFRVINIHVPRDQIIDTVELFHLPRQRMISLKFLAWYFLKINIQSITHDSVEDARTALQLYLKYQEMSKEGMDKVRKVIKEMYEFGRKNQWKISEGIEEATDDNAIAFL